MGFPGFLVTIDEGRQASTFIERDQLLGRCRRIEFLDHFLESSREVWIVLLGMSADEIDDFAVAVGR